MNQFIQYKIKRHPSTILREITLIIALSVIGCQNIEHTQTPTTLEGSLSKPLLNPSHTKLEETFYTYSSVDPCQHWDDTHLDKKNIEAIFPHQFTEQTAFNKRIQSSDQKDREQAIHDWLLSTHFMSQMETQAKQSLKVVDIGPSGGHANLGIYTISVQGQKRYIAKISSCQEASNASKLTASAISHPNCIAEKLHQQAKFSHLSIHELTHDIFHLAHSYETALIPTTHPSHCIYLMDLVPGKPVGILDDPEIYTELGKQAARLHSLGWSHQDMHGGNVFYEKSTGQVSYIDLSSFEKSPKPSLMEIGASDVKNLGWIDSPTSRVGNPLPTDLLFTRLNSVLDSTHSTATQEEDWIDAFKKILNNKTLLDLDEIKLMQEKSKNQEYFFRGYMSQLTDEETEKFKTHWVEQCKTLIEKQLFIQKKFKVPNEIQHEFISLFPELLKCSLGQL